jgi:hypothetical protein
MTDWGRRPPPGQQPEFAPGDRVLWHHGTRAYPATVEQAAWYRRTREPWQYTIMLDRCDLTRRMTHLLRFPPQSQLSPAERSTP